MPYEESELEFASGIGEPPEYAKKLMAEVREKSAKRRAERTLDNEVERSASKCPGGESCKCCGAGCNCGCRNECPRFRGLIASKIRERDASKLNPK